MFVGHSSGLGREISSAMDAQSRGYSAGMGCSLAGLKAEPYKRKGRLKNICLIYIFHERLNWTRIHSLSPALEISHSEKITFCIVLY